jgi:hypothetical protein
MDEFHVEVGAQVSFRKTVAESDVYLFAGITGDFSGNHVDEEYMKRSSYGARIVHGALLVGFMSTKVSYTIREIDTERRRSRADVVVRRQDDTVVAVAEHLLKWVAND